MRMNQLVRDIDMSNAAAANFTPMEELDFKSLPTVSEFQPEKAGLRNSAVQIVIV